MTGNLTNQIGLDLTWFES